MSLIDSSAWIELFRGTGSRTHRQLRKQISSAEEMATTEPVAMELLAGARSARDRRRIKGALAACRMVSVHNAGDWEDAAAIYLSCRRAGATPRRLLDCLIAAIAIRAGIPVLAADRDYELISRHTALELVE
ncbi:MAG TPA: PIN domain-containing protein [Solirubrobacterales bacterium]|jgi:predicted nucleic acid-binding protein|nr:PIN domain-containing protein [Solirubrobacterales bacterium]